MKKIGTLLVGALLSIACNKNQKETEHLGTSQETKVYQGLMPCADCGGIFTTIELQPDHTYEKKDFYLDKAEEVFSEKGQYTVDNTTGIYTLISSDTLNYLLEGETLNLLNQEKQRIEGEPASMYQLKQLSDKELDVAEQPVEGFLVMEQGVGSFRPCTSTKTYLIETTEPTLEKAYQHALNGKNSLPVKASLVVEKKNNTTDKYAGTLVLKEIKQVESITADNFCK